jgi:hypothetical protein
MQTVKRLLAIALAAASVSCAEAVAQVRCEPTLAQPCKPPEKSAVDPASDPGKRREPTRLQERGPLPDIQFDKDTSLGVGHGGIIGLERKLKD